MGCGKAAGISTSKVPGPAELAEGLPWHSPALKKALDSAWAFQGVSGWRKWDWEALALAVVSFHGLMTSPARAMSGDWLTGQLCIFSMESGGYKGPGFTPWVL